MPDTLILLFFLLWLNFLPPLANLLCPDFLPEPLDRGRRWHDGQPIFGPHKTLRGVLAALGGGTLAGILLSFGWQSALATSVLAMAGDLLSSFIKRRCGLKSGSSVPVLDQFFEGLFPALFLARQLSLGPLQICAALLAFVPLTLAGSRFWLHVVQRPPDPGYPRIVRSTVRLREWRACHQPLARYHLWFNFPNFALYRLLLTAFFKGSGLWRAGLSNGLQPRISEKMFFSPKLPPAFDNFRILFLSDLHLDGMPGLTEAICRKIENLQVDLCLLGGDIRMDVYGPTAPCLRLLRRLLGKVRATDGIFGVLGNHDCIEMLPDLEEAGMLMLVNDALAVTRDGVSLWLVGLDDPHYYRMHDPDLAFCKVPSDAFSILLAHSPEAIEDVLPFRPSLYLCGHTHGGQICLPGGRPLYTNSRAKRATASGSWHYRGMPGYTSRGVGASGVPLRFHCPGEICLFTLRCGEPPDPSPQGPSVFAAAPL